MWFRIKYPTDLEVDKWRGRIDFYRNEHPDSINFIEK
jgi:hypothetical protein